MKPLAKKHWSARPSRTGSGYWIVDSEWQESIAAFRNFHDAEMVCKLVNQFRNSEELSGNSGQLAHSNPSETPNQTQNHTRPTRCMAPMGRSESRQSPGEPQRLGEIESWPRLAKEESEKEKCCS